MPQFKARQALEEMFSGGDPRRSFPTPATVEAQSVPKAQAWFDRLRREAPIEVAVVGDLSLTQALPLLERYFGSLPKRPRSAEFLDQLRRSPRPPGPLAREVKVETVTPQAVALVGFAGAAGRDLADSRALELAANLLTSRLVKKIREELSLVYSIGAGSTPSWIYEDAGRFSTGAPCDPTNAAKVIAEVQNIFQDFAAHGPTTEELENGKKQMANHLDVTLREPAYWWALLRNYDLHRRDLAAEKGVKDAFAKLTAAQVQAVFQKCYTPARTYSVAAIPVPAPAPAGGKKP